METGLISIKRAALILKKDRRTVAKWIEEGLLSAVKEDGVDKINASSVYQIRDLIDTGKIHKPYERLALLEVKLRRVERTLNSLLGLHNAGVTTALSHLKDRDLARLLREAKDIAKKNTWTEADLRKWASVFIQLSETELTRIELVTKESVPWRPFLGLCNAMIDYWRGKYNADPLHHEIAFLLNSAKKHLRSSIIIYVKDRDENLNVTLDFFDTDPAMR